MKKIKDTFDFHKRDFVSVQDTVNPNIKLKDFRYYFDFVTEKVDLLIPAIFRK